MQSLNCKKVIEEQAYQTRCVPDYDSHHETPCCDNTGNKDGLPALGRSGCVYITGDQCREEQENMPSKKGCADRSSSSPLINHEHAACVHDGAKTCRI